MLDLLRQDLSERGARLHGRRSLVYRQGGRLGEKPSVLMARCGESVGQGFELASLKLRDGIVSTQQLRQSIRQSVLSVRLLPLQLSLHVEKAAHGLVGSERLNSALGHIIRWLYPKASGGCCLDQLADADLLCGVAPNLHRVIIINLV